LPEFQYYVVSLSAEVYEEKLYCCCSFKKILNYIFYFTIKVFCASFSFSANFILLTFQVCLIFVSKISKDVIFVRARIFAILAIHTSMSVTF